MNEFSIKTKVCFGDGALSKLKEFNDASAVIFTDGFMEKSGTADKIASLMTGCKKIGIFSEIKPDPPIETVAKALDFLLKSEASLVVALGGGSSIDAAKSTVMIARRESKRDIRFVAIPTTSGTGSEVTRFAVITDAQKGVKYPLVSEDLLPELAILSPELTVSVPAQITADTGFDVITHAIEAYVSTGANDFSDALCEKALEIAFEYLPQAYSNPSDLVAREKMHTASCLAGMAFNAVSLGAVHGIAHALGANFHIPHGRANAMMLPYVMQHNAGFSSGNGTTREQQRFAKIARLVGISSFSTQSAAQALIQKIIRLERSMGIPSNLKEAGVTKEKYLSVKEHIVKSALNDACTATNPVKLNASDIEAILTGIESF